MYAGNEVSSDMENMEYLYCILLLFILQKDEKSLKE